MAKTLVVDCNKCTLCGLCAYRCPTGALGMVSTAEEERLEFHPGRCVACDLCVGVCPEKALQVYHVADPGPAGQPPRGLERAAAVHCSRCGERLSTVNRRRRTEVLPSPNTLCPACRIGASLFAELV